MTGLPVNPDRRSSCEHTHLLLEVLLVRVEDLPLRHVARDRRSWRGLRRSAALLQGKTRLKVRLAKQKMELSEHDSLGAGCCTFETRAR